jgi:hypothetical protein
MQPSYWASYLAFMAFSFVAWWQWVLHPAAVMRWREPVLIGVSIVLLASPMRYATLFRPDLAQQLLLQLEAEAPLWGWARLFLVKGVFIMFVAQLHRLVLVSLGFRLWFPVHLVVHLAGVAFAWSYNHDVCWAIALRARQGGGDAIPGIHDLYRVFSLAAFFLSPLPVPLHHGPVGQCRCVATLLQVLLGYMLPLAGLALWEIREYSAYCREHPPGPQAAQRRMHRIYTRLEAGGASYGKLAMAIGMVGGTLWLCILAAVPTSE